MVEASIQTHWQALHVVRTGGATDTAHGVVTVGQEGGAVRLTVGLDGGQDLAVVTLTPDAARILALSLTTQADSLGPVGSD